MKINTKLRFGVYIPVLIALFVIIALLFSYRDMVRTQENGDTVRRIRSEITELNHIIFAYTLYHEERPKQQFTAEHQELTDLIASARIEDPDQQQLLDRIRQNNEIIEDLFLQLVSAYESGNSVAPGELQGTEDRLTGLLLLRSYEADSTASKLRSLVDAGIKTTQIRTIGFILAVVVLTTIPLTIVLSRTRRGIISALSNLNKGAATIGSGNLDFRIEEKGNDEITDLSHAFNQMTANLKTVTASKTDLQREIEERKKAEEELKESVERLRLSQEVGHVGTFDWDIQTGVNIWTPQLEAIYGLPPGGFAKTQPAWEDLVYPDDRAKTAQLVEQTLKTGTPVDGEWRVQWSDRSIHWISGRFQAFKDSTGKAVRMTGVNIDITERKQAEEELKRSNAELEAANKELEAFSYSVSHDLRQPLRALDGFSLAVVNNLGDKLDETNKDYLNRVRKASQTMGQLINDLLKLSRINRVEMSYKETNLSELANSIIEELKQEQPERQAEFQIAPELIVRGDKQLLDIALKNILENAWKYSGKCPQTRIEMGTTLQNGEKAYFIRDNGAGFEMKYADKLFQPFQRLHSDKDYDGTGIGLATVQRIIRRHGGRVWVESEVGKGTTIFFTL
jgi:PAS domain S-box-containing protein